MYTFQLTVLAKVNLKYPGFWQWHLNWNCPQLYWQILNLVVWILSAIGPHLLNLTNYTWEGSRVLCMRSAIRTLKDQHHYYCATSRDNHSTANLWLVQEHLTVIGVIKNGYNRLERTSHHIFCHNTWSTGISLCKETRCMSTWVDQDFYLPLPWMDFETAMV